MDNNGTETVSNKDVEALLEVFFKIKKMNKKLLSSSTLSFSEMGVLATLKRIECEACCEEENIQMSDISSRMHLTKSAFTQIINKLENEELVERFFQKNNRRSTYIRLTDKGKELFAMEKRLALKRVTDAMDIMGKEDSKEFIRLIRKFADIFIQENDVKS